MVIQALGMRLWTVLNIGGPLGIPVILAGLAYFGWTNPHNFSRGYMETIIGFYASTTAVWFALINTWIQSMAISVWSKFEGPLPGICI